MILLRERYIIIRTFNIISVINNNVITYEYYDILKIIKYLRDYNSVVIAQPLELTRNS